MAWERLPFGRRSLLRGGAAGACLAAGWPFGAAPPGDAVGSVLAFHERTKHLRGRAARGPGRVEWRTQPDPFRRFEGAALLPLDLVPPSAAPTWDEVLAAGVAARRVDHAAISQVLFDSLSLSAWKERGPDRWSLRVNPSSGNLHPTEAYLAGGPFAGLSDAPALLHYAPREHGLELRARLPSPAWAAIAAGLPGGALLAGLSVIEWRERWKYGERAWRYTLLDIGHAVGALSIAAAALGWRVRLVETWPDRDVARLLGVDRQEGPEAERAEALLALWPGPARWAEHAQRAFLLPADAAAALSVAPLQGQPNRLGEGHRRWPAIDEAVRAAERTTTPGDRFWRRGPATPKVSPGPDRGVSVRSLVRQRRTALGFDRRAGMTRDAFFRALLGALPSVNRAVFDPLPWEPAVHLAVLVHHVEGLPGGAYLLPRHPGALPALQGAIGAGRGRWAPVEGAPPALPLLRLTGEDLRERARIASCDQDVAADGAFTAAMLAWFEPALAAHGAWMYRRLHLEAGAVGQALYLEAEAAGLRATAMGCFLDDETHAILGVEGRAFQVIYHLAVGRPVEDPRLRTLEPYGHLRDAHRDVPHGEEL